MSLCPHWRHLLSLIPSYDSEATADPTDYFDEAAAQFALDFFPECLTFIEGERAGQPFELEPWQQAIIAALFGWKRADGTRRYREALLYVPRKSGKTPLAAGITLLVAFTDDEPGAQLYSAAADRDQAALIFRHCSGMIERSSEMASRSRIYRSFKSIEFPNSTIYKALSSDAHTKHGLGAHLVIVDELHAHPNGDLVDVLQTSTGARRQPLIIHVTTADVNRPSVCTSKYNYATQVRDGIIQDRSFLPVIYEALPDEDWTAPDVWAKANPNLGVSVKLEYLERECRRAQSEPSYQNTFRRLHLNQRTSQDVRWLDVDKWDRCKSDSLALDGQTCYAGLDLSTTTDISAFVLVFPNNEKPYIKPFFWIPEAKLKDKRDRVPYAAWARDGHVTVTSGDVIDYDRIRADIKQLSKRYHIASIAMDTWNATQLGTQLAEQDGFRVFQHRQGFTSMTGPSKEFERLIVGNGLTHDGNPLMSWMISNVAIKTDPAGNIKPDKSKSTERIDGVVAAIMANGCMMANPIQRSKYENTERELTFV